MKNNKFYCVKCRLMREAREIKTYKRPNGQIGEMGKCDICGELVLKFKK